MSSADKAFTGSIPETYDGYLVPLIFESYAADLARRVVDADPSSVLETAAGTGVVPRALAPLLKKDARYVVTDLNQPMLDRAASRQGADARITWQQADALQLPFPDHSFDVVCCQFGAMFFPDRVAGYKEARRVLKPGGRFIFNVWDRIEANDFALIVSDAAADEFPHDPPRFLARTPYGYHDAAKIEADLKAAGLTKIEIETVTKPSTAKSSRDPAIGFAKGSPLRTEIEARDASKLDAIVDRAGTVIARKYGNGPISGTIQALVATARA